jgi:Fe-S-cluster containining protein
MTHAGNTMQLKQSPSRAKSKTNVPPTARSARKSKADGRARKPKSGKAAPRALAAAPVPVKARTQPLQQPKAKSTTKSTKQRLPLLNEPVAANTKPESKATCTACGLCCSYVAIEIDAPATVKAATQMLWYVYHDKVSLYVNADEWMVQFDTTCIHLQPDYRCGVYMTRPHICREFSEQDCEVNTGDDGHTFYTAAEFLVYLKQTRPRIHNFIQKNFAPPPTPAEHVRTKKEAFEERFADVVSRRQALGIERESDI